MTPQAQDDIRQAFTVQTIPSRTWRIDIDRSTVSGSLDRAEAVAQAVYLILNTERYEWLIHSWNYGVELHSLIGKDIDYCIPEIERRITEALLQDDRITAVANFKFTQPRRRVIGVEFTVRTIYGSIQAGTEVSV